MNTHAPFTKLLALVGTGLIWLPLLAPLAFGLLRLVAGRRLLIDYLMPAELFPVVLAGSGLLLWAALRARAGRALIGGGLGVAVVALFGSQVLAVVTGLASGETEPSGWPWALVVGTLGLYTLALAAIGVGGWRLLRRLLRAGPSAVQPA